MPTQTEIDRDYKRLKVLLEATDSFVLTFVLYRDIKEQRTNAAKLKELIDLPVTEVALKGDNLNPVYTFLDLPREPRQAIFYTFLGSSLPEGKSDFDKFAGYVNIQREAFTDAPHAVVLWLREEQLVRLMRRAPDFWAWRSGVFDVRGELQPDTSAYRELEEVDAFERGELETQVALYREILKAQLEREKPDSAYIARTKLRLVDSLQKLGLYEEMTTEAQEVVNLATDLEDNGLLANSLNNLALAYEKMNRFDKAEPLYREAISLRTDVLALGSILGLEAADPIYSYSLNGLGNLYRKMGRYAEAEPLLRKAVDICVRTVGKDHPNYAVRLSNLAGVLRDTERYEEAEMLYREALGVDRKVLGEKHPNYASRLNNLANLLVSINQQNEAESLLREAIEIETSGKEHPERAIALGNLATLLHSEGRYDEAEPFFREAIAIEENILDGKHPGHTMLLNHLANQLSLAERYDEAEALYRKAIEIDAEVLGEMHPDYASRLNNLASLLERTGRYNEAEKLYREALDICTDHFGENHPITHLVVENHNSVIQKLEQQNALS